MVLGTYNKAPISSSFEISTNALDHNSTGLLGFMGETPHLVDGKSNVGLRVTSQVEKVANNRAVIPKL